MPVTRGVPDPTLARRDDSAWSLDIHHIKSTLHSRHNFAQWRHLRTDGDQQFERPYAFQLRVQEFLKPSSKDGVCARPITI